MQKKEKNNTTWQAQGFFNTDKILEYLSNINIMNFLCNQVALLEDGMQQEQACVLAPWASVDSPLNRSIYTTVGLPIGLFQFVGLFLSFVFVGEPEQFINDFLSRGDGRFNLSMLQPDFLRGRYLILLKCLDAYYLTK